MERANVECFDVESRKDLAACYRRMADAVEAGSIAQINECARLADEALARAERRLAEKRAAIGRRS